jgi:hypothetical protein
LELRRQPVVSASVRLQTSQLDLVPQHLPEGLDLILALLVNNSKQI